MQVETGCCLCGAWGHLIGATLHTEASCCLRRVCEQLRNFVVQAKGGHLSHRVRGPFSVAVAQAEAGCACAGAAGRGLGLAREFGGAEAGSRQGHRSCVSSYQRAQIWCPLCLCRAGEVDGERNKGMLAPDSTSTPRESHPTPALQSSP